MEDSFDGRNPNDVWNEIKHDQVFLEPLISKNVAQSDCTRIVCISDTHNKHRELSHLPAGDILIHAGDFTLRGEVDVIEDLSEYFGELSSCFESVIVIAGNHDRTLQRSTYKSADPKMCAKKCDAAEDAIGKSAIYLQDASYKTKSGIEIYGSPWTPMYFNWAFMLERGPPIRQKWEQIPASTDILITHGPPLGRGDDVPSKGHVGCNDLGEEIRNRIRPRVNVFGHIHEGYGVTFDAQTLFVNASSVDVNYKVLNHAIVIDVPHDKTKPAMLVPPIDNGITVVDLPDLCDVYNWNYLRSAFDEHDLEEVTEELEDFSLLDTDAHSILTNLLKLDRVQSRELAQLLRAVYARSFPE